MNTAKELYALTDDVFSPDSCVIESVKEILNCGIKIVQYRSKKPNLDEKIISNLIEICDKFGAKLILNDNVRLAKKLGAHGVHIGKDDGDFNEARRILGTDKIIGASCYNDLNLALKFQNLGADYVAFGSVFKSPTKPNATFCDIFSLDLSQIRVPIALIGGISQANLAQIKELPVKYFAIVSAVYRPNSITQNLRALEAILRA